MGIVTVSLRQFLQTGRFGILHLGLSVEQIVELVGPPEAVGGSGKKNSVDMYKYGSLEIYFDASPLHLCHTLYIETIQAVQPHLPSTFRVEEWNLPVYASRQNVEAYLHMNAIPYKTLDQPQGIPEMLQILPSEVLVSFADDDLLWSFSSTRGFRPYKVRRK